MSPLPLCNGISQPLRCLVSRSTVTPYSGGATQCDLLAPGHSSLETMTQEDYRHPIAPPPELVQQWMTAHGTDYQDLATLCMCVATRAAQWGWDQRGTEIQAVTDQELEACCQWLEWNHSDLLSRDLRAARRPSPKTPSLKERLSKAIVDGDERQALKLLEGLDDSL